MKRAVIIGAGPAGLTAGYELLKRSEEYEVVILEESGDIGGIAKTVEHNGNRMDMGGHRFFSKDERVNLWWEEIAGDDLMRRDRVSRIYYDGKLFDYPIKLSAKMLRTLGLRSAMQAGFSFVASSLHKKEETSLENFYINRFGKKLYSMFFETYTEKVWGRPPKDISADWGAQRVKGLSVSEVIKNAVFKNRKTKETSLIESFIYPKLGPGQLWEKAADRIRENGGKIMLNCRAERFISENGRIKAVEYIEKSERRTIECDEVLSSMPVKDLIAGMDAPEEIKTVAEGLPYRDFVTVGLLVKKMDFEKPVPDCWIYIQDGKVKLGRVQVFNNWSPYLVADSDTVWLGLEYFCCEGDEFWNLSDEETARLSIEEIKKTGLISQDEQVLDWHCERVKKAYPAYFDTYDRFDEIRRWLDETENLYCIGRNGQHRYNNMDHSMATAFEAVENILTGRKDKENIWNVNTEKEYAEEK